MDDRKDVVQVEDNNIRDGRVVVSESNREEEEEEEGKEKDSMKILAMAKGR